MVLIHFILLFFIVLLQFQGISGESHFFFRAGQDATLPCEKAKGHNPSDSVVDWFYYKDTHSDGIDRVRDGQVVENSPGSSRVSLNSDRSLIIRNVTEEDAGRYICRLWDSSDWDSVVYLGVLTVSPPGPSPNQDGRITLQCTVSRYDIQCKQGRLRWLDQNKKVLSRNTQNNCVSYLTVERQSQHNRKYTCQYLSADNKELISGVSQETDIIHRYHRTGEDASLPCDKLKHQGPACSNMDWLYYKDDGFNPLTKIRKGQVVKDSPSSSRLTLNSDCSLNIHNITEEDSGLFVCGLSGRPSKTRVYLNVLTVSPAPDTNTNQDGSITLQCTLQRYIRLPPCSDHSFHWLDQNTAVLSGDNIRRTNCESYLTVERQSQHNRKYTCQYLESSKVQISADFSLEVDTERVQPGNSDEELMSIICGAVVSLLVLLVVAVVVFFKIKSKSSPPQTTEDTEVYSQPTDPVVDPENNLTYAMINHQKPTARKKEVVEEDTVVIYSAVTIKTAADCDHSAIYSAANKTK